MRLISSTCFAILISLLLLQPPVRAQQVVFSEDFNTYPQINFSYPWSSVGSANVFHWRCDIPYILFGLGYINFENGTRVAGLISHGQSDNVLLVTPSISLTGAQNAYLSYDSYFRKTQSGGRTESATVEISTDNGTSWTVLKTAPVSAGPHMVRSYVNLSAYNNAAAVRLGFRYSDSLKPMTGWMLDNIKVFIPAEHDIALVHAYPEDTMLGYLAIPDVATLSGTVMNNGTAPVTAFSIQYQEGTGPVQTHTVTGLNIAPFDTLGFVHAIPHSIAAPGRHDLKMWAVIPGDTVQQNDTLPLILHGAQFVPTKKIAIEEGSGTWNVYSPRGYVYLHALDASDNPPVRIAVHSGDVMEHKAYSDYLYYMDQNFVSFFLFDRRGPVPYTEFFERYEHQRNYFGFADIDMQAVATAGHVSLDATIRPAVDLPGSYRLALVITEDGVTGTTAGYAQANAYAGGGQGPMGGFETKPHPVPASDMKYDYVARSIDPSPEGRAACLPAGMQAGQRYSCNLHATYSSAWTFSRLNAIVLFIRDADSSILNSRSIPFRSLGIESMAGRNGVISISPNPAGSNAMVAFELTARSLVSLSATDITGRTVLQHPAGWIDAGQHKVTLNVEAWPSGMYFVTLEQGGRKETVKLSVVH